MDTHAAETLLTFAESAGEGLRGADAKAVFQQLDARYGELQSALSWFIEHRRTTEALRLATALVAFWMATKRLDEASTWFDRVLALPEGDTSIRGRAAFDAGYLAFWKGNDERSAALQQHALEIGRRTNNPTVAALALVGLARIALQTSVDEARQLCREALAVTDGTQDRAGRSSAMHVLAVAAQMAGDFQEARELMRQRIAPLRETLATLSRSARKPATSAWLSASSGTSMKPRPWPVRHSRSIAGAATKCPFLGRSTDLPRSPLTGAISIVRQRSSESPTQPWKLPGAPGRPMNGNNMNGPSRRCPSRWAPQSSNGCGSVDVRCR